MSAVAVLSIVMLVLGCLSNALGLFPFGDAAIGAPAEPEYSENIPYSSAAADDTAMRFNAVYFAVVDDLMSFREDPDLAQAETRREEVTAFAQTLTGKFEALSDTLGKRLGELTAAPLAPTNLAAAPSTDVVALDWDDNAEPDLAGYNVYRSTIPSGPYTLAAGPVTASSYLDPAVTAGTAHSYVVTAIGESGAESEPSNEASATPI